MFDFIPSIAPEITWAVLGIIFIFVEFFIPGLVIAFFGVGALLTSLTTLLGITNSLASQRCVEGEATVIRLAESAIGSRLVALEFRTVRFGRWNPGEPVRSARAVVERQLV